MKASIIIGTRSELIKLAPVVHTLRSTGAEARVVFTGQCSPSFLRPWMDFFHINPDLEFHSQENQNTENLSFSNIVTSFEVHRAAIESDYMVVLGGSDSALAGAQFAFQHKIPLAHVEAGLRTHDLSLPFPEEGNRQMIARLAKNHFAPTFQAARNLMQEGISREALSVVGNTGVDSLQFALKNLELIESVLLERIPDYLRKFIESESMVLVSIHRSENQERNFNQICENLLHLANEIPSICYLFPLPENEKIREHAYRLLGASPSILLCDSMPYLPFVYMMSKAKLIITDSSGILEEAPSLRIPVLLLQEKTDRMEAVDAGFAKLVGLSRETLLIETLHNLKTGCTGLGVNPFGDGTAAKRIVKKITGSEKIEQNIIVSIIEQKLTADILEEESLGKNTQMPNGPEYVPTEFFNNVIPLPTNIH